MILCIVHVVKAVCSLKNFMILSARSMLGNAPAAEKCWIPLFLLIGLEITIPILDSLIVSYLVVSLQGSLISGSLFV